MAFELFYYLLYSVLTRALAFARFIKFISRPSPSPPYNRHDANNFTAARLTLLFETGLIRESWNKSVWSVAIDRIIFKQIRNRQEGEGDLEFNEFQRVAVAARFLESRDVGGN